MKPSWQDELFEYIDNDFEKHILKIATEELNPDEILQSAKEFIREKLHEHKKSDS